MPADAHADDDHHVDLPGTHDPTGAEDISTRPSLSDDGRVAIFISDTCGLVPEEPQMAGEAGVIVRWMR